MRLIDIAKFTTHDEIHLRQFIDLPDKRYAILSHTWGEAGDEVNFGDLENPHEALKKPGFAKIKYACTQALSDGYAYVWRMSSKAVNEDDTVFVRDMDT